MDLAEPPTQGPEASRAADAALLQRLRDGEDVAYEQLLQENTARMLAVARRFLRSEDDARDAVQDAFLSAFRALEKFEGQSRLSTWLHRITVNASLMKLRTRRRRPEESIDELLPGFLESGAPAREIQPWSRPADDLLESKENRVAVRGAIGRLPEKYRTVLMLRDIEDYSTEETANALDLSIPAVKTRLHRARQGLKALLDPHFSAGAGRVGGEP
jgi:RNA polymerase sigma-70 factor (ECF subfamily)